METLSYENCDFFNTQELRVLLAIYNEHGVRDLLDEQVEAVRQKLLWEKRIGMNRVVDHAQCLLKAVDYYELCYKDKI